jgi:hypothetical protein
LESECWVSFLLQGFFPQSQFEKGMDSDLADVLAAADAAVAESAAVVESYKNTVDAALVAANYNAERDAEKAAARMESILRDMDLITDMAMNDVLAAEQRVREEEVQKWSARLDVLETSVNNQAAALIKHAEARAADAEARAADAEARAADAEARAADAEARAADAEARAADAEARAADAEEARAADAEARAADAEEARAADAEEARAADAEEARAAESRAADADEQPGTTTELIEVRIWCMCLQESFRNRECVLSSHLTRVWVCPR